MEKEDYDRMVYQAKGNATHITRLHMDVVLTKQAAPIVRRRYSPESHEDEYLMENFIVIDNPFIFRQIL